MVHVPLQPRSEVPRYLRLADVLVQPGAPDAFNDYRLPVEAARVPRDRDGPSSCRRRISAASSRTARSACCCGGATRSRSPQASSGSSTTTSCGRASGSAGARVRRAELQLARERAEAEGLLRAGARDGQRGRPPVDASEPCTIPSSATPSSPAPRSSYATVRDYCDSVDHLPLLATASRDLKDVQRPWALKAIVGSVRPGSRLLEIGAGEPIVADLLARARLRRHGRRPVRRPRRRAGRLRGDAGGVPAASGSSAGLFPRRRRRTASGTTASTRSPCSSTSRCDAIEGVCAGILRSSRATAAARSTRSTTSSAAPATPSISAASAASPARSGIADAELDGRSSRLADDPETYFLSAEGHNRWRGGVPYDEFPMRRCVSIQLCLPVGGGLSVSGDDLDVGSSPTAAASSWTCLESLREHAPSRPMRVVVDDAGRDELNSFARFGCRVDRSRPNIGFAAPMKRARWAGRPRNARRSARAECPRCKSEERQ